MISLSIEGIGIVAADMDRDSLCRAALEGQPLTPSETKAETSELDKIFPPRKLRRVDHFTRMSMLAACRALRDSVPETDEETLPKLPDNTAIIISSGYGPAQTVFEFLDSMIDFGPGCASPLSFSHSVHNIPAATLAMFLGGNCPYTTICQPRAPLAAGLMTAACWLAEGRAERVLLGTVDESTPLLEDNTRRILAEKGMSADHLPVIDSAGFFLLSAAQGCTTDYGCIGTQTITVEELARQDYSGPFFVPARTLPEMVKCGLQAASAVKADQPTAAGLELAAASFYARAHGAACCLEKNGKNFGLIRIRKNGE
ncbi:beta-ketoacyl synthase chain length factor [Maridesulfovibrio sp.]|uniref:beta-ketoacyl synthase chain length factor n=1 Tax=Maridesulfovibrio sp. TaxID=2795000 RepID=UPI002A18CFFF|nr:beta-ketoacyl synthase chain length factor [Maridesulfovibrio sp.]